MKNKKIEVIMKPSLYLIEFTDLGTIPHVSLSPHTYASDWLTGPNFNKQLLSIDHSKCEHPGVLTHFCGQSSRFVKFGIVIGGIGLSESNLHL